MCETIASDVLAFFIQSQKSREKYTISSFGSFNVVVEASRLTVNGDVQTVSGDTNSAQIIVA
ncbi:hypothetical protein II582_00760 [bacterium]|nr:hypothetical protein [bacterium]